MARSRLGLASIICIGVVSAPILAGAQSVDANEARAWEAVRKSVSTKDVFAFIEAHPNGTNARKAKALMIDLLWIEMEQASHSPAPEPNEAVAGTQVSADVRSGIVRLQSEDNLVALSGEFLSFNGALITIKTSQGIVGVRADGIECIGAACPAELRP